MASLDDGSIHRRDQARSVNPIAWRIAQMNERVRSAKEQDLYLYLQPAEAVDGAYVTINGRRMLQFASYAYLNLLGHPRIRAAAQSALDEFGPGTHGVRVLAGTTRLHVDLERKIAEFKQAEAAMVLSSGYVTNLGVIAALLGRNDVVISDKLNHASIVDGCLLSRSKFVRFDHNDMADLEKALAEVPGRSGKLVVADAVFSMDGDIIDLPEVIRLCRKYDAMLMIDEAHSLGVLGETGHGILEHFGLEDGDGIDIKMGTLSKTIPAVGGYVAGRSDLITYLKHSTRAFIFSAALPPPAVAAAIAGFEVIEAEPERIKKLQSNVDYFIKGLQERGFNTLKSETPIVPIIAGSDERAWLMAKIAQEQDIFVMPIVSPAVPAGTSRLRANVMVGHSLENIEQAMDVFESAGKEVGVLPS
ncbi:MAG: aminotransferase class I/II-fold pyridoxal phosphate-dependent enzyme [Anaerolineae bacterium]|nr:aminotransferase class I/II-fold pyridoxal phosphate-dependent enzyme [Anaerolineae bacterium]